MIVSLTTVKVAPGRLREAIGFWSKLAEYHKKKHPDVQRYLLRPVSSGYMTEIVYISVLDSLAFLEESTKEDRADPEFQDLIKEGNKMAQSGATLGRERKLLEVAE